jgi:3-methylcrotonyl-CoA carboxylase alpha subunit
MSMFAKVLIANRGEIACRVAQTCRRLGIATVAVYSDADRHARHVRVADEARRIGPAPASESYLRIEILVAAAIESGAQAVHPGYGFLSENAQFARECERAGLVFIGPRPDTIEVMGSKSESKRLMEQAGVPTVPGYHGELQSLEVMAGEAQRVGFPLLVKASAGGGGKGMRIVRAREELEGALASARREALAAFGDDRLLIERFLERPRHIEFQVFGDSHGHVMHLYERECSVQRRYQKIIEETPSPFLDDALRGRMGDAAVAAARAVSYVNAGTVEFIVGEDRSFYFMEMNTRLQVEHPVTEMTTGLDLVEWQLRVAAGERLPLAAGELRRRGHSIEARIYAERPYEGFLPATGRIARFVHPAAGSGVRIDAGVEDGDEVSIHYDPMIAKLIVAAADRPAAVASLSRALAETAVFGVGTNLALLRRIAADARFAAGAIDTGFVERHLDELLAPAPVPDAVLIAAAVREMLDRQARETDQPPLTPWDRGDGWRANGQSRNRFDFEARGGVRGTIVLSGWDGRYVAQVGDRSHAVSARTHSDELALEIDGERWRVHVRGDNGEYLVTAGVDGHELTRVESYPVRLSADEEDAHPRAPMPGRVVAVHVQPGQRVRKGDALVALEGMKMEHTVRARRDGRVERVLHGVGEQVEADATLVDLAADDAEP